MTKNKIYIAGKVTGLPYSEAKHRFDSAEKNLTAQGYTVVNPTKLVAPDTNWQAAMRTCIAALCDCTHIYILNNFATSDGACMERNIAAQLQIIQIYE